MKSAVILPENTLDNSPDQLSKMRQTIEFLTLENRLLQEKINYLLHHRFGPKSERFTEGQALLFDNADIHTIEISKEEEITVPEHIRKKGGRPQTAKRSPPDSYRTRSVRS